MSLYFPPPKSKAVRSAADIAVTSPDKLDEFNFRRTPVMNSAGIDVPKLEVSLSPYNTIIIKLPSSFSKQRDIELSPGNVENTLLRILEAISFSKTEIGLDGAPTIQQVEHWEKHSTFPRDNCRFCIGEGRVNKQHVRIPKHIKIRRVLGGVSGKSDIQMIHRKLNENKPKTFKEKVKSKTLTLEDL